MNEIQSPICRGDNARSIPVYQLPGEHEERESIYFWQNEYRDCDSIWMRCGPLEIPCYKQLADPNSELSKDGRKICRKIETITGIPTYYFLMRYYGRRKNEADRLCPGCGQTWKTIHAEDETTEFSNFAFRCTPCRLVSHHASSTDDERHARIGEWKVSNLH